MRILFTTFLSVLFLVNLRGQSENDFVLNYSIQIETNKYGTLCNSAVNFISERADLVISTYWSNGRFYSTCILKEEDLPELDTLLRRSNLVKEFTFERQNKSASFMESNLRRELDLLNRIKGSQIELEDMEADSTISSWSKDKRRELVIKQIENYEEQLSVLKGKVLYFEKNKNLAFVDIEIGEKSGNSLSNQLYRIKHAVFDRSIGVGYNYFLTSSPNMEFSAPQYEGFSINYLFEEHSGAIGFRMFNAVNTSTLDSQAMQGFNQLFFEKNYFSKTMNQRYREPFFNPFIGWQGGVIQTSNLAETKSQFRPEVGLVLGMVLVQGYRINLDVKSTYMVPIDANFKYFSGVALEATINFRL